MSPEQCEGSATGRSPHRHLRARHRALRDAHRPRAVHRRGLRRDPRPAPDPAADRRRRSIRMMSPHVELVVLKALEKRPRCATRRWTSSCARWPTRSATSSRTAASRASSQRTLMPSTAPLPPVRLTPSPLTPIPGHVHAAAGLDHDQRRGHAVADDAVGRDRPGLGAARQDRVRDRGRARRRCSDRGRRGRARRAAARRPKAPAAAAGSAVSRLDGSAT